MRNRKGFTLVELLLVVAILAFLVAIIVIAASNISEDSKKKSMYASLRSVKSAVETYYLKYNEFPGETGAGLVQLRDITPADQRLMDSIPEDLFDSPNKVSYSLNGNDRTYAAWSVGPVTGGTITVLDDDLTIVQKPIYVTNAIDKVWKP